VLGLIAGEGAFPLEIARAVRRAGRPLHAVAFPEITDPGLAEEVSSIDWLPLGAARALIESLHAAGAREIVLAGKVDKTHLHRPGVPVAPDALALDLLAGLEDRADGRLLSALAELLEREGFALMPQARWVPDWLAGSGPLGQLTPKPSHLADMNLGVPIARALAGLEVGQCVAVEAGTVLAVEAIEGTDAAIERAGKLGAGHAVLVKVARPVQDPRLDCPAVGPRTLEAMAHAGFEMLAVEAGRTIVIGGDACLARADQLGIAVWGVEPVAADPDPIPQTENRRSPLEENTR
jgi:DUF1009 family protein